MDNINHSSPLGPIYDWIPRVNNIYAGPKRDASDDDQKIENKDTTVYKWGPTPHAQRQIPVADDPIDYSGLPLFEYGGHILSTMTKADVNAHRRRLLLNPISHPP